MDGSVHFAAASDRYLKAVLPVDKHCVFPARAEGERPEVS